jgi:hypothetical protein
MSGLHPIRSPIHTPAVGSGASTSHTRPQGVSMPASGSTSGAVADAAVQNVANATIQQPQTRPRTTANGLQARSVAWEAPRLSLPRDVLVTNLMPFLDPEAAELTLASNANEDFQLAACTRAERLIEVIRDSPGLGQVLADIKIKNEQGASLIFDALQEDGDDPEGCTIADLRISMTAVLEKVVQQFHNRVGAWRGFWAANTLPLYAYLTDRLQSAGPAEASDVHYWKSLLERLFAEELAVEEVGDWPVTCKNADEARVLLRLLDATWEADRVLQDSDTRKISAEELTQRVRRQGNARRLGGYALREFFGQFFEQGPDRFFEMVDAATSTQSSLRDSVAFWASVVKAFGKIPNWEITALENGSPLQSNRALAIAYAYTKDLCETPPWNSQGATFGFDSQLSNDLEVVCAWVPRNTENGSTIWKSGGGIDDPALESHPIRHRNFLLRAFSYAGAVNSLVIGMVPEEMLDEDFVKMAAADSFPDGEVFWGFNNEPDAYMEIRKKIPGFKGSPLDRECLEKLVLYRERAAREREDRNRERRAYERETGFLGFGVNGAVFR